MSRTIIEDRCQKLDPSEIKPLGDRVLLRVIERTRSVEGLFIVGQNPGTELCIGEVMAVGEGILNTIDGTLFPMEINVGETVLTIQYMGDQLKLGGNPYRLVRENGIWAKVKLANKDAYEILDLEPRFACILVEIPSEETVAKGRLVLPDIGINMKERLATVVKVGPGQWHMPSHLRISTGYEPDQKVLMTRYAGAEIRMNGKDYRLVQCDDLKCIMEGELDG